MESKTNPNADDGGLVPVTVRMSPALVADIDKLAQQDARLRGGMIRKILIDYVKQAQS